MNEDLSVDYVQDIIEASNSIFHNISDKDFQGIHAIIEIIVGERPINQSFGAHIISTKNCFKKKEGYYEVPIKKYFTYLEKFELPVILFVINEDTGEGYWTEFNKDYIVNDNFFVKSNKSYKFNFKYYNTIIIDYFLNKKKTYSLIENFILNKRNTDLKIFLISIFKIVDFSIPLIMENNSFIDFLESLKIEIKINSILESEMMSKAIDVYILDNSLWYFRDTDGAFTISPSFFNILKDKYNEMTEL